MEIYFHKNKNNNNNSHYSLKNTYLEHFLFVSLKTKNENLSICHPLIHGWSSFVFV